MAPDAARPTLKSILEGKVTRLQEKHATRGLTEEDLATLATPAARSIGAGHEATPAFMRSLLHGKESLLRRSGQKREEAVERVYEAAYANVVLAVGLSLQRNRQTVTTMLDTPAGGLLEADVVVDGIGQPGLLTIGILEDAPGRVKVEAVAEFEAQLKIGAGARRVVQEFLADTETYLRKVQPGWQPPRPVAPATEMATPPPDPNPTDSNPAPAKEPASEGWTPVDDGPTEWLPADEE